MASVGAVVAWKADCDSLDMELRQFGRTQQSLEHNEVEAQHGEHNQHQQTGSPEAIDSKVLRVKITVHEIASLRLLKGGIRGLYEEGSGWQEVKWGVGGDIHGVNVELGSI